MTDAETAIEALADAWASIDGNLDDFRAGKTAPSIEDFGGHYAGYIEDAKELAKRLQARGFWIAPWEATAEMKKEIAFGYTSNSSGGEDSFDYISEENVVEIFAAMRTAFLENANGTK